MLHLRVVMKKEPIAKDSKVLGDYYFIQRRHFGFLWLTCKTAGPFGSKHGWCDKQGASDKIVSLIKGESFL